MRTVFLSFLFSSMAMADVQLVCESAYKIEGWVGHSTSSTLRFNAVVASSTKLKDAEVSGAYQSDSRTLKTDSTYKPVAAKYKNHVRFGTLEDAWCWFNPILPRDFAKQDDTFTGYLRMSCEDGRNAATHKLACNLYEE